MFSKRKNKNNELDISFRENIMQLINSCYVEKLDAHDAYLSQAQKYLATLFGHNNKIYMLVEISSGITLYPGTILATGTPKGVGMSFEPKKFLNNGDIVRIEIENIGTLENKCL